MVRSKQSFLAELSTLLSGNVLAQAITLAAYFLLTRLYSPSDFGLYNILFAYIELLIIFSTCRYEQAVVAVAADEDAGRVARAGLWLNTLVSLGLLLLLSVVVAVIHVTGWQVKLFNLSALGTLALLIPPMVFFSGTSRIYAALFNRNRSYRPISASAVTAALAGAASKVAAALLGWMRAGLPVGTVVGQAVGNIVYRLRLPRDSRMPAMLLRLGADESAVARREIGYAKFIAPRDALVTFSSTLPIIWLSHHFGEAQIGFYSLALTCTFQPVLLLCGTFERILFARAAEGRRTQAAIGPMLRRFMVLSLAGSAVAAAVAWLVAEPVIGFCFGRQWLPTAPYLRALLPWMVLFVPALSLSFLSNLFNRQRVELRFALLQLALRAVALAVGIAVADHLLAIRLYAASSAIVCTAQLVWYLSLLRRA